MDHQPFRANVHCDFVGSITIQNVWQKEERICLSARIDYVWQLLNCLSSSLLTIVWAEAVNQLSCYKKLSLLSAVQIAVTGTKGGLAGSFSSQWDQMSSNGWHANPTFGFHRWVDCSNMSGEAKNGYTPHLALHPLRLRTWWWFKRRHEKHVWH